MDPKPPKQLRKRERSPGRKLKDQRIIQLSVEGDMTTEEIAKSVGVTRKTVSKILNSDEVKALIEDSKNQVRQLLTDSITAVSDAINQRADIGTSARTALAILKSEGVVREKTELEHSFPRPTVIKKLNGEEVTMTTTMDEKSAETEE